MQDAVGLVDADAEPLEEGDVAEDDAEADGQEQQRFVLLGNGQPDKERTDHEHDQVAPVDQAEAGVAQKLQKKFHEFPLVALSPDGPV